MSASTWIVPDVAGTTGRAEGTPWVLCDDGEVEWEGNMGPSRHWVWVIASYESQETLYP